MSAPGNTKPQVVFVDEDTASLLSTISAVTKIPTVDLVKAAAQILKYGMGRKIVVEGKKKVIEISTFEKCEKVVIDLDE